MSEVQVKNTFRACELMQTLIRICKRFWNYERLCQINLEKIKAKSDSSLEDIFMELTEDE